MRNGGIRTGDARTSPLDYEPNRRGHCANGEAHGFMRWFLDCCWIGVRQWVGPNYLYIVLLYVLFSLELCVVYLNVTPNYWSYDSQTLLPPEQWPIPSCRIATLIGVIVLIEIIICANCLCTISSTLRGVPGFEFSRQKPLFVFSTSSNANFPCRYFVHLVGQKLQFGEVWSKSLLMVWFHPWRICGSNAWTARI